MERGIKMASSNANTWVRRMIDVASLPRIKLNNLQDLPGAKKKVCCVFCVGLQRCLIVCCMISCRGVRILMKRSRLFPQFQLVCLLNGIFVCLPLDELKSKLNPIISM